MGNAYRRDTKRDRDDRPLKDGKPSEELESRTDKYVTRFVQSMLSDEHIGFLLLDKEFRIVEISQMICSALGEGRDELIGREAEGLFRKMPAPLPIDVSLLRGQSFRNRRYKWRSGRSRQEWMLDGETLMDEEETIGAYVMFRDITQLSALEEQVRRSDRLKMIGEVAAGTAHEIRNPLTAIKGFLQLLQRSMSEKAMARELDYVGIVLNELDRVSSLVNEFLLLSKPKEIRLLPVHLGRLFSEMIPMLRNEAVMHNVNLRYEPRKDLPPVFADMEMLKQVFLNLGKNGIEAMKQGGTLTIRERCSGTSEVVVDICDTGPGIPQAGLERIFDPFFTTKEQGTGLGLSICQRIVHELGGRIEVTTGDAGTMFSVAIPAYEEPGRELASGGGALPLDDV